MISAIPRNKTAHQGSELRIFQITDGACLSMDNRISVALIGISVLFI
jgi:hypothetical protein